MKKFLLLSVFILTAICSFAGTGVKVGVKAGANAGSVMNARLYQDFYGSDGKLIYSYIMEPSLKLGFHVGAFAEMPLGLEWSLRPEVYYSHQGARYKDSKYVGRLRMDYVNIPLLVRRRVSNDVDIEFGPQVGFLVKSDLRLKANGNTETHDLNAFSKVDLGVVGGAGFLMWESENGGALEFDVRVNMGVTKIDRSASEKIATPRATLYLGNNMLNYNLQAGLAYCF